MRMLEEVLLTYALNAVWQVPLLCLAAAGTMQLMKPASVGAVHRVWVATWLLAVALPAVPVALGTLAKRPVAPSVTFSAQHTTVRTSTWTAPQPLAAGPVLDFGLVGETREPGAQRVNWTASLLRSVAWLYGAAVGFALGRLLWGLWLARTLQRKASAIEIPAPVQSIFAELCARFGVRGADLLACSPLASPATLSLPRPVVLLPLSLLEADAQPMAAALAHELAHVKRHDFVRNIGYEALGALIFFHPASHWLRRRLAESREMVCDDLAATVLEGRAAYAGDLLRLAESALAAQGIAVGKALGVLEGDAMEKRIMALIEAKAQQAGWRLVASVACGVALLMLSLTVGTRFGVRPVFATSRAAAASVATSLIPAVSGALTGERLRLLKTVAAPVDVESTEVGGLLTSAVPESLAVEMPGQGSSDLTPVPFQLREVSLKGDDKIAITSVRGTTKTIEWENLYEVKGTYTLASADKAILAINVTTSSRDNSRKDYGMGPSRMAVQRGSGSFTLWFYMLNKGEPHLSFYPAAGGGSSFASVYFGSAGAAPAAVGSHADEVVPQLPESLKGWFMAGTNPRAYKVWVERPGGHDGGSKLIMASRSPDAKDGFGTVMQNFSAEAYRGKRLQFRAWVKSEDVKRWAGLWMRVDTGSMNDPRTLAFDNMQNRKIMGTTDWTEYSVVLDVAPDANDISFGILLDGPGQVEMSALKMEAVAKDKSVTDLMAGGKVGAGPINLEMRKESVVK